LTKFKLLQYILLKNKEEKNIDF